MTACDLHAARLLASVRPHVKRAAAPAECHELLAAALAYGLEKRAYGDIVPVGTKLIEYAPKLLPALERGGTLAAEGIGKFLGGASRAAPAVEGAVNSGAGNLASSSWRFGSRLGEASRYGQMEANIAPELNTMSSAAKAETAAAGVPKSFPTESPTPGSGWDGAKSLSAAEPVAAAEATTQAAMGGATQAAAGVGNSWRNAWGVGKFMPQNWYRPGGTAPAGSFMDKVFGTSGAGRMLNFATMFGTGTMAGHEMDFKRELTNAGDRGAAGAVDQIRQMPWTSRLGLAFGPDSMVNNAIAQQGHPAVMGYMQQLQSQRAQLAGLDPAARADKAQVYGSAWNKFKDILSGPPQQPNYPQ